MQVDESSRAYLDDSLGFQSMQGSCAGTSCLRRHRLAEFFAVLDEGGRYLSPDQRDRAFRAATIYLHAFQQLAVDAIKKGVANWSDGKQHHTRHQSWKGCGDTFELLYCASVNIAVATGSLRLLFLVCVFT